MIDVNRRVLPGFGLSLGYTILYMSLLVAIPMAAGFVKAANLSLGDFWHAVSSERAVAAYTLTVGASFASALVNVVLGVFNLIPIPPLDAGTLALRFLPYDWAVRLAAVRPYGFMIATALAIFGVVPALLLPFYGVLVVVIRPS